MSLFTKTFNILFNKRNTGKTLVLAGLMLTLLCGLPEIFMFIRYIGIRVSLIIIGRISLFSGWLFVMWRGWDGW